MYFYRSWIFEIAAKRKRNGAEGPLGCQRDRQIPLHAPGTSIDAPGPSWRGRRHGKKARLLRLFRTLMRCMCIQIIRQAWLQDAHARECTMFPPPLSASRSYRNLDGWLASMHLTCTCLVGRGAVSDKGGADKQREGVETCVCNPKTDNVDSSPSGRFWSPSPPMPRSLDLFFLHCKRGGQASGQERKPCILRVGVRMWMPGCDRAPASRQGQSPNETTRKRQIGQARGARIGWSRRSDAPCHPCKPASEARRTGAAGARSPVIFLLAGSCGVCSGSGSVMCDIMGPLASFARLKPPVSYGGISNVGYVIVGLLGRDHPPKNSRQSVHRNSTCRAKLVESSRHPVFR